MCIKISGCARQKKKPDFFFERNFLGPHKGRLLSRNPIYMNENKVDFNMRIYRLGKHVVQ